MLLFSVLDPCYGPKSTTPRISFHYYLQISPYAWLLIINLFSFFFSFVVPFCLLHSKVLVTNPITVDTFAHIFLLETSFNFWSTVFLDNLRNLCYIASDHGPELSINGALKYPVCRFRRGQLVYLRAEVPAYSSSSRAAGHVANWCGLNHLISPLSVNGPVCRVNLIAIRLQLMPYSPNYLRRWLTMVIFISSPKKLYY